MKNNYNHCFFKFLWIYYIITVFQLSIITFTSKHILANSSNDVFDRILEINDDEGNDIDDSDNEIFDSSFSDEIIDYNSHLWQSIGTYYDTCKIIIIDKITANSQELDIKVGESIIFGHIEIKPQLCWNSNDLYQPESYVLLTINESNFTDKSLTPLFQGWLSSTRISISNFEHPLYEIIAKTCYGRVIILK